MLDGMLLCLGWVDGKDERLDRGVKSNVKYHQVVQPGGEKTEGKEKAAETGRGLYISECLCAYRRAFANHFEAPDSFPFRDMRLPSLRSRDRSSLASNHTFARIPDPGSSVAHFCHIGSIKSFANSNLFQRLPPPSSS
jgi:hypothetical protein